MKTIKLIFTTILIVITISIFSDCNKNKFNKPLEEVLIEHSNWRLYKVDLNSVDGTYNSTIYNYETDTSECRKNSYFEFLADSINYDYKVCEDTIEKNKWFVTKNGSNIINIVKTFIYYYDTDTVIDYVNYEWNINSYNDTEFEVKSGYPNDSQLHFFRTYKTF